ncbi:hypothetical protein EON65_08070 [archaeon]|nr:MAG: hypothetical protein EON65_08070 [archaeon]
MASSHSKHIQDALALVSSGEVSNVLKAQKAVVDKIISNYQQSQTTPTKELTETKDRLECLFFVFYRVQAFEEEVHEIQLLIQSLSNALAFLTNSPIIGNYEPYIKNDFVQSLYYLLVLAQLIMVCMLQQTVKLYSRDDPALNLWVMDDHGVNADDCGNNIPQVSGSREELDTQTWQCTGAKAFSCLVYAVFRQPEVDMDRADPTDVEWFLHEASLLRGYSYIRLCIIPVLQALASHDQEMALFLLSVLKELLENIVHIFCLSVYNQANALHEKDFPYIFFPPTQAFYTDNVAYYNQIRETDRHAYCGKFGMFMIEEIDSLEDILLCFGALIEVYPSFAAKFWPQEVDEEDLSLEVILQHAYQFERSRLSCFHPFLGRLFDISAHYQELVFPTMDFLTDISNAPGNHSRKVCFSFVFNNTSHHPIINWPALIQKLELVSTIYQEQKLAIDNAAVNVSSMDSTYRKLVQGGLAAVGGGGDSLVPKKTVQLSTLDMEALLSISRLLRAMLKDIDLAVYFYQSHQLIGTLFSLLSCPLFIEVKQEIVGCLTCYARIDLYRAEIWQELDNSNMLSLYSKTGGIKHELEQIESQSGNYYLLNQFLILLGVLFQHPLPEDLGAGNRVPGVLPYLAFVIDEVLLKAEERFYSHPELLSFQAQQYKIITRCLLIFYEVLVRYQVHHVSAEEILYYIKLPASVNGPQPPAHIKVYLSDLKDEIVSYTVDNQTVTITKPKSPGYFLMLKLLSNSKLTEFIMKYLTFMTADNFKSLEAEYIESELGTTLQYFKEVFIITPEHTGIIYQSHHILAKQHRLFEEKQVTLADAKVLPIQSHPIYWLEYGCGVCLAFMYEVSLRSHAVKYLRQHIDTPAGSAPLFTAVLSMPVAGPTLYEFAQILSNHQFTSILLQILSMTFTTYATNPSVYFYALKIIEYLAIYHTTNQSQMVSLLSAYPVDTVAKLLLDDVYYLYHNIHDRIVDKYNEYHIRLLGSDSTPNSLNPEYSNCSIRQALVDMLLASYLPKHYTYSHYFMGISSSSMLPFAGQMTCLDALLNLLSTDRVPLTLLEESPYLAVDVYELLFVFCQDEFSREQVLNKLRQENFFAVHLNFIAYVMHFDILDFYHQIKQRHSRNELYAHIKYAYNVDDLQIAINHSAAYIFAMTSLELVQSQSPKATVGMLTSRQKLMKLLLGYCDNLDFSAERSDTGVLVCNKVLMYILSSLYMSVTSRATLPDIAAVKGLVRHYSRKLSVAKASASYSVKLKTDSRKVSPCQSISFDSIDVVPIITNLRTLVEGNDNSSSLNDAQIKDTVKGIVTFNLKSRLHAACKHVITASQELFCILFYLSHEQVLSVAEDHDRCLNILQHFISALPVVDRAGVGLVGESLARTVLSIIAYTEKRYMAGQQGQGWKYADDHMELWCMIAEKLVDGLSNQQSLADLTSRGAQTLGNAEGLSSEYQGLVCLAISRVLALLVDMKQSGGNMQQDDDVLNVSC